MAIKASANITLSAVRDLESCTRYYLLQSSTSAAPSRPTTKPPGGNWVTAEPAYTTGSTNSLYTVDLNLFSDGSWAYSEVSLSSSYEAAKAAYNKAAGAETAAQAAQDSVDNLQIGGRNLLRHTAAPEAEDIVLQRSMITEDIITVTPTSSAAYAKYKTGLTLGDLRGKTLMFSIDAREIESAAGYDSDTINLYCALQLASREDAIVSSSLDAYQRLYLTQKDGWNRYALPIKVPDTIDLGKQALLDDPDADSLLFCVYLGRAKSTCPIQTRHWKLEYGDKATDWTPAPEDVDAATAAAQSAADAAALVAAKALSSTEVIVGTQTAATGAWTGVASFSELTDGQQIVYWLPFAGSGNATLNLTLSGGNTTGAVNVYINGTSRCTTHVAAGNAAQMVYRKNVTIGTGTYTGWWVTRSQDTTTNNYDRIRLQVAMKAKSAIVSGHLIVGDDEGYYHLGPGVAFDVNKPALYAASAINAGATGTGNYIAFPTINLRTTVGDNAWTVDQYATIYLAGRLTGHVFTALNDGWLTTDPDDTTGQIVYMSIGYMYSAYQMYLYPEHPMYRMISGELTAISQIAYEAQLSADSAQEIAEDAKEATDKLTRYITITDEEGMRQSVPGSTYSTLVDEVGYHIEQNGEKIASFYKRRLAVEEVRVGALKATPCIVQRRSADGGLVFIPEA